MHGVSLSHISTVYSINLGPSPNLRIPRTLNNTDLYQLDCISNLNKRRIYHHLTIPQTWAAGVLPAPLLPPFVLGYKD